MNWIISHIVPLIGCGAVVGFSAAFVSKYGLSFVEKEVAKLDAELLAEIKDPAIRQFCVEVEAAAVKLVPDAGDARYSVLADLIIKDVPQVAPGRPLLIAVLTAIGSGAKAGISDATKNAGPVAHS